MNDNRWSLWKRWDLHVHTPFSYLNNGFWSDFDDYVKKLFKKAIENEIKVIWITDYFCIEGYKKIKQDYLGNDEKMSELFTNIEIDKIKKILVLPNIEFRLNKLINEENRVNYHVIFSDKVSINDIEENFLHELEFIYEWNPSSSDEKHKLKLSNIEELWKKLKIEHTKFNSDTDLFVWMKCAVVDDTKISDILNNKKSKFEWKYLIFTPADEDLSGISWDWQNHNIRKVLIQKSNWLFTSNEKTIKWWLWKFNEEIEDYIKEFKSIKPCIWWSDAHDFDKLFSPDNNKYCWIKADLTFEWLKQIIYEPEERVFIWEKPEVLNRVKNNKTKYIKSLKINQINWYDDKKNIWFKNQEIELNNELVAIIWNKWNWKSAIADILGFLWNTHNSWEWKENNFSFLNRERFRKDKLANNFEWVLVWEDTIENSKNLWIDEIDKSENEKVRYLPQNFFNTLTNDLDNNKFTKTLENVIFNHLDDSLKLWKISFTDLKEYKTKIISEKIEQIKFNLIEINKKIVNLENKKQPDEIGEIKNKIIEKEHELKVQEKLLEELVKVRNPNEDPTVSEENKNKFQEIERINIEIIELDKEIEKTKTLKSKFEINKQNLNDFLWYFDSIEKQISDYKINNKEKYLDLWLNVDEIIKLEIDKQKIKDKLKEIEISLDTLKYKLTEWISLNIILEEEVQEKIKIESLFIKKENLLEKIEVIKKDLSKQEQDYQNYLEETNKINKKIEEIKWERKDWEVNYKFDTLEYYKNELKFLEETDQNWKTKIEIELANFNGKRLKLSIEIYNQKKEIINLYKQLKDPIDKKVEENKKDLNKETQINIDAKIFIKQNFNENFLKFINQWKRWTFNWLNEWEKLLKEIYNDKDLNEEENIKEILNNFIEYLNFDKRVDEKEPLKRNIFDQVNKLEEFYNYIFSLDYIDTKFELKSWEKSLEKLSPWEKWTLLLIFYLMIDEEWIPLIIDQPEDNLDNQSVFSMLSTFIKKAKKKRQIIIVTHNPNLAVWADAEQIIYTKIDKENWNTFSFESWSIENKIINNHIVNILEWTIKAFNKRELKYIKQP